MDRASVFGTDTGGSTPPGRVFRINLFTKLLVILGFVIEYMQDDLWLVFSCHRTTNEPYK